MNYPTAREVRLAEAGTRTAAYLALLFRRSLDANVRLRQFIFRHDS